MTKADVLKNLEEFADDAVVVCMDEEGGWDNIQSIEKDGSGIKIVFGGGSPFSDE
jgi:hypothetical protein